VTNQLGVVINTAINLFAILKNGIIHFHIKLKANRGNKTRKCQEALELVR